MLHRDHKVEVIRKVPLFSGCSKKELQRIAHIADEIDLRAETELTRQGAPGSEFFVLLQGEVDVIRDGKQIDTLHAGDFFGEVALVSDHPRNATVRATTPVRALVITSASFLGLLKESPEIQLKVLQALVDRLAPDQI